jgi:hypothetical protein
LSRPRKRIFASFCHSPSDASTPYNQSTRNISATPAISSSSSHSAADQTATPVSCLCPFPSLRLSTGRIFLPLFFSLCPACCILVDSSVASTCSRTPCTSCTPLPSDQITRSYAAD